MRRLAYLTVTALAVLASPALAHYNMLLPAAASGKKGEAATFTYQFGHPYEHQLFDAPPPEKVTVHTPAGKLEDLTKTLEKVSLPAGEGKKVAAYRFQYTPDQRGDHVFYLQTPPIWMEEDGEYLQDTVKVVFHVQAQKGWDAQVGTFEAVPLTRPYGLEPGMVFQAQFMEPAEAEGDRVRKARLLPGVMVEIERFNAEAPKKLPPDEQITRTAKTDPNGVVTCTLTDAGWWAITAIRDGGTRKRGDKDVPLRRRTTLWVFVDEKVK